MMSATSSAPILPRAVHFLVTTDLADPAAVEGAQEALRALLEGTSGAFLEAVAGAGRAELLRAGLEPREAGVRVRALLPGGGGDAPGEPLPLVRSLADILADPASLRPPEAVVRRLAWRGRTTLLAAREKEGKSTLSRRAAATASRGGRFLGERCLRVPVLVVALEEAVGDVARSLHDFGADPSRVFVVDRLVDPFNDLARAIETTSAGLVVVDTLAAFAEGLVDDPSSSSAWTAVMSKFTRLTRDSGTALLLLHHARKSDGAYRDSSAIGAGVDVLIEMRAGEEQSVRRFSPRGRWPMDAFSCSFDGKDFHLVAGELSLDARVELFVQHNAGASMRAIRGGVTGKAEAIQNAVERLVEHGAIEDRGDGSSRAFYLTGDAPPMALPFPTEDAA
ncbi:MAG TPA: AAA family ATPase [Longimicrobiales bacterium]|nr:AAA family ATPase [Longimicrobiales bacterium]